jgi:signal transduction histidine kinase
MDKPVIEKLELNNWLSESVALFKTDAMKKEISLTFKPLHKKLEVEIDKPGMEKIIVNLISNAIRYTPDGGEVSVECFSRQRGFGFSVRDNGIGMEKDELEKIFDEFYRSKKAKEMEQLGTGLGLNLVKEIVRINNGAITVDSTPGKGSIFTVELPYKFIVEEETEEDPERLFFLFE